MEKNEVSKAIEEIFNTVKIAQNKYMNSECIYGELSRIEADIFFLFMSMNKSFSETSKTVGDSGC
ncbi:MAG: hypothetical protein GY679_00760 [Mycoplasma sp.]|nr:hypothetical protein [Mycoplasma sp.]